MFYLILGMAIILNFIEDIFSLIDKIITYYPDDYYNKKSVD